MATVVGGTRRHAYEPVARLVVRPAGALATAGAAGREFVVGFRAGYPRHVAFRRDLARLSAGSPILARHRAGGLVMISRSLAVAPLMSPVWTAIWSPRLRGEDPPSWYTS